MEDVRVLIVAVLLLVYSLTSRKLHGWWVSMPAAMVALGWLVGPGGLDFIEISVDSSTVKLVAEATLALMLFHDASRIGLIRLRDHTTLPLRLLGIGLPVMIALGTLVAHALIPSVGWLGAALMATMLAPTDAALGEEVVTDKRLPGWLRQGMNVESGLNDGLSVPVFLVLLGLAVYQSWESGALINEFIRQVGFGVLAGAVFGGGGGLLVREAQRRGYMLGSWVRYAVFALAMSCFVAAAVLHGSGFIGAFVGGLFFGATSRQQGTIALGFTSHLGTMFDTVSFVLLGVVLVPVALEHLTWQIVVYAVLSLVAIRTLSVFAAMIGSGVRWQTAAFMGWFGPRGLATVVFTLMLLEENIANRDIIAAVAVVGVVLSVYAHGFSAPGLAGVYEHWYASLGTQAGKMPENRDVAQPLARGFAVSDEASRAGAEHAPQLDSG